MMAKQYQYGRRSREQLATCHDDLQKIMHLALAWSIVDFGIVQGVRTVHEQLQLFLEGKSRLDPRNPDQAKKAKHLPGPDGRSIACDIVVSVPGRPDLGYDFNHLCTIAGTVNAAAEHLLDRGEITHRVRWGGNWDGDGQVITDQKFNDLVHFELVPA